ncbi:MAG: hypothetical protein ACR2HX_24740 [Pyrinomonadaceae bacterium]
MKVNRARILVMSALAMLGTLTLALAVNVGSKMPREVVSPKSGPVESVSSRNDANTVGNTMVKGKPTLLAEVGKPTFVLREPIIIKLTLRNGTDAEIYRIDTNPVRDNQLEIKNSAGDKMPLSEKAKKALESPVLRSIVSRIAPGQVVQYEIDVLDSYDLSTNGTYTVTVKRKIVMQDKKKFVELESNPVKVVVQP